MRRSLHPTPEPPPIPEHDLLRCIGWGSYGEVWLARHRATGAWHAVKLVYRESFDDDRPYEREFEGIRGCEPISHGHEGLIDILQVGRDDEAGFFYYVMELADDRDRGRDVVPEEYQARTLRSELMEHGSLPLADCLEYGRTLAQALAHLHGEGLVHRDIKPSNIVFVNGAAKLADIGLVTSMDATYSWVGTPGYIPQEGPGQIPADIFSLGKVIYEIATGNDRHDFPLLPANVTGLRYLNEVLLRACARLAEDRHKSADELATDLERVAEGRPPLSRERKNRRRIMALAAALVLGGLAWGVYEHRQPDLERGLVLEMALPGEMKLAGPVPMENHRGEKGTALFFDGSDDRAEMPLPEALGPDVTLAVWAKSLLRETSGSIAGVFGEGDGTGAPTGLWLEARNHGKFALRRRQAGEAVLVPEAVSDIALKGDGTWHLLIGVIEGGRLRLYVDGRLQQSTAAAAPLALTEGTVRLGHDGAAAIFRGGIGRLWVFNRALNEAEARLLFERQGQMDPLRGLVAHYPLNGNGEDVSGQNRPLNLQGCQPAVDRHGLAARALAFDGVDDSAKTMSSGAPAGRSPRTLALWAMRDANQTAARPGVVMTGYAGTRTAFGLDYLKTNQVVRARPGLEAPFPAGQWVHLAATYDGVRTRLYVNGRFAGQVAERLNTVHERLFLGVNALVRVTMHFQGALDELRIYNRALTAKEVAGLVQLEQTVPRAKTQSKAQPQLLFPNSNFSRGTLEGWRVVHNVLSDEALEARPDGTQYVKILVDAKMDGGHMAEAKEWESGVTLVSPPIKINPGNRILLARYCKPFGVSSCNLVVFTSGKQQQLLEQNLEPNLVERQHDLKPWLGQTIRIGFSGGWMRMDYLKTLPAR